MNTAIHRTHTNTRTLTYTAMLAAIATVVMFFEFTFPPFPPFLKFDLSGLPILLAAFLLGPAQAVAVTLIKDLIHLLSTTTGGVGELADFLILSSFASSSVMTLVTEAGSSRSCSFSA